MIGEAVAGAARSDAGPRPWVDKFGAWYHTGGFDAQRRVAEGLSLADPTSTGAPKRYRHNQGACAIAEVPLCRRAGQSLAAFARGFTQPSDRSALAIQADVELTWAPPFKHSGDIFSLGLSQVRIGHHARGMDQDLRACGDVWWQCATTRWRST
jgi:porin